jgi:ABC-type multidrug transport system permease subunit
MDENSTWILNSDSYLSDLNSDVKWFENINLNWHSLYLWNEEISSMDGFFQESKWITTVELTRDGWHPFSLGILWIGVVVVLLVFGAALLYSFRKNR